MPGLRKRDLGCLSAVFPARLCFLSILSGPDIVMINGMFVYILMECLFTFFLTLSDPISRINVGRVRAAVLVYIAIA